MITAHATQAVQCTTEEQLYTLGSSADSLAYPLDAHMRNSTSNLVQIAAADSLTVLQISIFQCELEEFCTVMWITSNCTEFLVQHDYF